MRATAWGAVAAVARRERRRRGRALLAIGLLAGLVGGAATGAVALARRTSTAYDRLVAAGAFEDARANLFGGDPGLAADIAELPQVRSAWVASVAVARVDGPGVVYLGILYGPPRPDDLLRPVVVDGRLPDPTDPDEVIVAEDVSEAFGVEPGDELGIAFLTPEEVRQFDVGFGEPDGPRRTLRVVGVMRVPGEGSAPVLGTPALAERDAASAAGAFTMVRLHGGAAGTDAFRRSVEALAAGAAPEEGGEEFVPVTIETAADTRGGVDGTAGVLVAGLLVLAGVAAAAGLLVGGQALARHHAQGAPEQAIESALGMTPGERVVARVLAASPGAAVAAAGTAAGAVAAGIVEPLGAIARFEPRPGFAPNVAVALGGAAVAAAAVLGLAATTAARAGAPGARTSTRARRWPAAASVPGGPAVAAGVAFADSRAAAAGAVIGVGGLVAALTFATSLDRLVDTPARYGWDADVMVVDANPAIVEELLDDERVAGLTVVESALVRLDGVDVTAFAATAHRGDVTFTVLDGRLPSGDDEVALGRLTADRIGARIGDVVDAGGGPMHVVGEVVVPPLGSDDGLGESVVVTPGGLAAQGLAAPFEEALVEAAPGQAEGLVADLGEVYEIEPRSLPQEVDDLDQLGALPHVLGGVLAAVGAAALLHALVTTVRRRSRDLAVLRAVGFTPAQVAWSVAATALVTGAVGLVVGLPVGLGVGRLVWWAVADATGVARDAAVPVVGLALVALVVPVVALAAAAGAAARAARLSPALLLRAE